MKLVRELLLLACLLLFSVLALMINLSFFSDNSTINSFEQKEVLIDKPLKPIKNQVGKQLFKDNCAACHNRNMQDGLVGPALGGVRERWANNDANIYDFIRNSEAVINSGNNYVKKLFNNWDKTKMTSFPNLKDSEIEAILNYIDEQYSR